MNNSRTHSMYVAIDALPFTKRWGSEDRSGKTDVILGIEIPSSLNAKKENITEWELKLSGLDMSNSKKSAVEIASEVIQNIKDLKEGNLYAKVTYYNAPVKRNNGPSNMMTPWLEDIELIKPTEQQKKR